MHKPEWTWLNTRVPREGEELSALEYIKRARRYSTTADAVRAAIVEFARSLGWRAEPADGSMPDARQRALSSEG